MTYRFTDEESIDLAVELYLCRAAAPSSRAKQAEFYESLFNMENRLTTVKYEKMNPDFEWMRKSRSIDKVLLLQAFKLNFEDTDEQTVQFDRIGMKIDRTSSTLRMAAACTTLINSKDFSDHLEDEMYAGEKIWRARGIFKATVAWGVSNAHKAFTTSYDIRTAAMNAQNKRRCFDSRMRRISKHVQCKTSVRRKSTKTRKLQLNAVKAFGGLLGKNYISRLQRLVSYGPGRKLPHWVKERGAVFGPGAHSGRNVIEGKAFNYLTDRGHASEQASDFDESKKWCDAMRRKIMTVATKSTDIRIKQAGRTLKDKGDIGIQFVHCEVSKVAKILVSLSKQYMRSGMEEAVDAIKLGGAADDEAEATDEDEESFDTVGHIDYDSAGAASSSGGE
jgi:hypothetical protein